MLALARAGLRTRLLLLAVIVLGCAVMRAGHFVATGGGAWVATDAHSGATIIVLGLAIPTFVILLGAMLLRGEHAPWSWLLARPTARTRLLAVAVVLDALTIAACVGAMTLVFGGFGYLSHATVEREIAQTVLPLLYVLLYLATAIGGARGLGSLRAGLLGVLWLGTVLGLGRLVLFAWLWLHDVFEDVSAAPRLVTEAGEWLGIDRVVPYALLGITLLAAMVVLVGVILPFVRAAASVPAVPRWRSLAMPPIIGFVACGAAAVGIGSIARAALADADAIGDTEVVVNVRWADGTELYRDAITLNVPGPVGWRARHGTRSATDGSRWVFASVPAGTWRLCARFRRVADPARTKIRHEFECSPIDVPPDGSISVDLDLDLDRVLGARR